MKEYNALLFTEEGRLDISLNDISVRTYTM